jgi:hypothetical protein
MSGNRTDIRLSGPNTAHLLRKSATFAPPKCDIPRQRRSFVLQKSATFDFCARGVAKLAAKLAAKLVRNRQFRYRRSDNRATLRRVLGGKQKIGSSPN